MENGDTKEILKKRLISIVSYHEKGGVWRRCYILSLALLFIILIVDKISHKRNNIYYWIVLLLLFFTIHYFFFNYINYHHFRNLKENAIEIINKFI
jgi:drug/metabolite transporter (DMT)-like permease